MRCVDAMCGRNIVIRPKGCDANLDSDASRCKVMKVDVNGRRPRLCCEVYGSIRLQCGVGDRGPLIWAADKVQTYCNSFFTTSIYASFCHVEFEVINLVLIIHSGVNNQRFRMSFKFLSHRGILTNKSRASTSRLVS